ncbi:MAG: hypothetical protein PHN88_14765 [Ignavibacteria bacterium]|nr:hypothetical protein [Ignavibacteria bacterium]
MDFEAYSEAGYIWSEPLQLWKPIQATKPGIKGVGAAAYSEHPSTEVLCLAYDLADGRGNRLWINAFNKYPYPPMDLLHYVANGGLIEAHNSLFEYFIWKNVCEKKYNWPPISLSQMRCSASRVRSLSIPGDLRTAAIVLKARHLKDDDGKRLINKFSIPKKPTKKDPRKRIRPEDDPQDAANIYKYCLSDVDAEGDISEMTPELLPQELKLWQLDQRINAGGVYIDRPLLYASIHAVETTIEKYTKELSNITGGEVNSANELKKMTGWLESHGLNIDTLQAKDIDAMLGNVDIKGDPRRVIEIRSILGLASVKKLYAMKNRLCNDGRIRDLFLFCGALHTGRWTGTGVQPQNLTASAENMDEIIADIMRHDVGLLEKKYGSPIDAVSSCLRGLFCAPPGRKLICSDFKAIEAVVLACLAGEQWRIDVFKTHGMIYEKSASMISGVPFQEFIDYPKNHKDANGKGEHHPLRKKLGKFAELACVGRNTEILTDKGYKKIIKITKKDKLWDGKNWINNGGVVCRGAKKTIELDGAIITPEHKINYKNFWTEAKVLVSNKNTLRLFREHASENLPLFEKKKIRRADAAQLSNAIAILANFLFYIRIYFLKNLQAVKNAEEKKQKKRLLNFIPIIRAFVLTLKIGGVSLIGYGPQLAAAIIKIIAHIKITAVEELRYFLYGVRKKALYIFYGTLCALMDGIIPRLIWIGQTLTEGTNRGILGLFLVPKIKKIVDVFQFFKTKYLNLKKELSITNVVYDITDCGPLSRFTIKTNSGHLIIHNSGYQGWIGAWKKFGADKYLSDEEIKQAILKWRGASPNIAGDRKRGIRGFWKSVEDCFIMAVKNPGNCYSYNGIGFGVKNNILHIRLPSGRFLRYYDPRADFIGYDQYSGDPIYKLTFMGQNSKTKQWERLETYGGCLTENIVQAVSRDILGNALLNLDNEGYTPVIHVHDEPVAEVAEDFGNVEDFEKCMTNIPEWAKGWPIKAGGGWQGKRYHK